MRKHAFIAASCSLLFVSSARGEAATRTAWQKPVPDTGALVERFLAPDSTPLRSYRALRRLTASTRGGRMRASIEAWTSLDPIQGFKYEIVSEEGSSLIRRKVLLAALDAEQKSVTGPESAEAALTRANYEFLGVSAGDDELLHVQVKPRRRHHMRVDGTLALEPDSADLVRVEGHLSQRPSFWTRKVRIQRDYGRINGVHVPLSMSSTADVLVVGASSFSMTYEYVEINGIPVDTR